MKSSVRSKLIQIGNSRGVRLPKAIIQQCGIEEDLEMTVRGNTLVIQAVRPARHGWNEYFQHIAACEEDHPITEKLADWNGNCRTTPVRRFEVYQVNFSKDSSSCPGLIVSPDEMNMCMGVVLVAPMMLGASTAVTRPICQYNGYPYQAMLEQIHTVGKPSLGHKLGEAPLEIRAGIAECLQELFK